MFSSLSICIVLHFKTNIILVNLLAVSQEHVTVEDSCAWVWLVMQFANKWYKSAVLKRDKPYTHYNFRYFFPVCFGNWHLSWWKSAEPVHPCLSKVVATSSCRVIGWGKLLPFSQSHVRSFTLWIDKWISFWNYQLYEVFFCWR